MAEEESFVPEGAEEFVAPVTDEVAEQPNQSIDTAEVNNTESARQLEIF